MLPSGLYKARPLFLPFYRVIFVVCHGSMKRLVFIISLVTILTVICMFTPHIRNSLLRPTWPRAWREIGTLRVISIKLFPPNILDDFVTPCYSKKKSDIFRTDIDTTKVMFYPEVYKTKLRVASHHRFLPVLTDDEKLTLLHTYLVLADSLQKVGIEFFLVEGSLLGVHRHHGMVPWDDDLDIAISVVHRKRVHSLLGCMEGFVLYTMLDGHWKFFHNSTQHTRGFPFVDIFFYFEDADYVWAVTDYLAQTVIFAKKDTFPLTTAWFEGLLAPVPKHTDHVARSVFDVDICQSPSINHKSHLTFSHTNMSDIPCSLLTYLYPMFNLKP